MVKGIRYLKQLDLENVIRGKCINIEVPYVLLKEPETADFSGLYVEAVSISGDLLMQENIDILMKNLMEYGADYLVIETEGMQTTDSLKMFLYKNRARFAATGINVCIENGYCEKKGRLCRNGLVSEKEFISFLGDLNEWMETPCFFAALNIGHAKLFGTNIPEMIRILDDRLKFVHANDNDGRNDCHQMPYTFLSEQGMLTTEWYRIIRRLTEIHFTGGLFFDVDGLFLAVPKELQRSNTELLMEVARNWEKQLTFEEKLADRGKRLILFGAGNMLSNYMKYWGKKYPPEFVVDNNFAIWGERRHGIKICPPRQIQEIPARDRNVLICSLYYKEIGNQLQKMGVETDWYEEEYWMD